MGSRRMALRGAVLVTVLSLAVAMSPGLASASHGGTGGSAKGTTTCFASGTLRASPPLTLGSGKATTLSLTATLHGCTGTQASKVFQATLSGKSTDASASCTAFENEFPPLSAKVSYKTLSGSLAPTKLAFSGGMLNKAGNPISIMYPVSGGKGAAQGSFASKKATMMLNLGEIYSQWVSSCQSSAGLSTMTVIGTSFVTV